MQAHFSLFGNKSEVSNRLADLNEEVEWHLQLLNPTIAYRLGIIIRIIEKSHACLSFVKESCMNFFLIMSV